MLFLFTSSDFSSFPSTSSARSNKSYRLQIFKMRRGSYLHTHTFEVEFHFRFPSGADPPASPDILTLLLQLVYTWASCFIHLRLLGQGKKIVQHNRLFGNYPWWPGWWRLAYLLVSLSDLISFPSLLQFNRQMNVSAALVQNFAFRFLPTLRESVFLDSVPAAAEWGEGQESENKGFSNWST